MARGEARTTRHSADEYAEWGLQRIGKAPQVYALEVATGEVVFLPEGGKFQPVPGALDRRSFHDRTKAGDFACLISGCGPFASVRGTTTRHHWVHPRRDAGPRPGHDPETLWHQQVKHHFARWVREQVGPDAIARLHVDDYVIQTAHGPVKPDVLIELVAGHRIAIEIQRSPGDPLRVKEKREAYAAAGIIDWWIYAPVKETMQRDKDDPRKVRLIASQMQMTDLQKPFYWFDLPSNRIATPYSPYANHYTPAEGEHWTGREVETRRWPPMRRPRHVYFDAHSLEDCRIDQGHLRTPVDLQIEYNAASWKEREPGLRAKAREQYRLQHDKLQVLQVTAQEDTEGTADTVPLAGAASAEESAARPIEQPTRTPTISVDAARIARSEPAPKAPRRRPRIWTRLWAWTKRAR